MDLDQRYKSTKKMKPGYQALTKLKVQTMSFSSHQLQVKDQKLLDIQRVLPQRPEEVKDIIQTQ